LHVVAAHKVATEKFGESLNSPGLLDEVEIADGVAKSPFGELKGLRLILQEREEEKETFGVR
jgi:hypothetical protein